LKKNPNRHLYGERLGEREQHKIAEAIHRQDDAHKDPVVVHAQRELGEIKKLATDRWGGRAIIQAIKDGLGYRLEIGFFDDDRKDLPPWKRREVIVARGRTAAEVRDILRLIEAARS